MPKLTFPAAGEAMPAAEVMPMIGRFSGRPIFGDVEMAAAAIQIQRDAASIAVALAIIHGRKYRIMIDHEAEFVAIVGRS